MRRTFKWSMYTLLVFLGMFFVSIILGAGFPEGSLMNGIGIGLIAAVMCTSPFVALTAFITGIATLLQGGTNTGEKLKHDYLAEFEGDSTRLRRILNRLSDDDRNYLEQYLAANRLGVADDGELVSLDELLSEDDDPDQHQSLFTG